MCEWFRWAFVSAWIAATIMVSVVAWVVFLVVVFRWMQ